MGNFAALPKPSVCDVCQSQEIEFISNSNIYGKSYGGWPYCWHCKACDAIVGCHSGTDRPLGKMANSATRELRTKAHRAFDPIWQLKYKTRKQAYDWLAEQLKIVYSDCHISWLSDEQLKKVVTVSNNYLANYSKVEERRKAKTDAKIARRAREQFKRDCAKRERGKLRHARRVAHDIREVEE